MPAAVLNVFVVYFVNSGLSVVFLPPSPPLPSPLPYVVLLSVSFTPAKKRRFLSVSQVVFIHGGFSWSLNSVLVGSFDFSV